MSTSPASSVLASIRQRLEPLGFECHGFQVAWYNERVLEGFRLPVPAESLAVLVISTPSMFELALLPFLSRTERCGIRDPVDECSAFHLAAVAQEFPGQRVDVIHDFDVLPSRRPHLLVQTAAHVAGAAFYYRSEDVRDAPWPAHKKMFGVCMHPVYGGWFAIRGALVFADVSASDLPRPEPPDSVSSNAARILLLEKFNYNWQDWSYRDVIPVKQRYSEAQKLYFSTPPDQRHTLPGFAFLQPQPTSQPGAESETEPVSRPEQRSTPEAVSAPKPESVSLQAAVSVP
ncbi:cyanocobalamin reductase / alkylcobalamin dealkylase isoform X1 [Lampetra fluviatilis]